MNTKRPTKIPPDWRYKAYTYYVVSFSNGNQTLFLTSPGLGNLGPASIAFEFRNKKGAKSWMRHWMDRSEQYGSPNVTKVRGLPKAERQLVELMNL